MSLKKLGFAYSIINLCIVQVCIFTFGGIRKLISIHRQIIKFEDVNSIDFCFSLCYRFFIDRIGLNLFLRMSKMRR